jgi:hypothetical protein
VLDAGHRYTLRHLDGEGEEILQFVKREGEGYPGNIGTCEGTTSEEVLRALIHRAAYVNGQIPCWQTKASLYLMGLVIWLYEHRAAKRHKRAINFGLFDVVWGEICKKCGHVGCEGKCH